MAGRKGRENKRDTDSGDTYDENIKTGSRDETLPLYIGMHDHENDEFIEGEVNWSLIPSAR